MTVVAAALSFLLMGRLAGVREGTVVAAVLVGFIVRFCRKQLSFLPAKLFASAKADGAETKMS